MTSTLQAVKAGIAAAGKSQGRCETTLTERFENPACKCSTYPGNLGPCKTFEAGVNGRCVYCDHELPCHRALDPSSIAAEVTEDGA